jgi:outer membrane protein TolC
MKVCLTLALVLFAASPALAQPGARPAAAADMAAFEKDLDALFVQGGLTADQAASRAGKVSPTVRRQVAEVDAAIASAKAAELVRVPHVGGKLSYTRLSTVDPILFPGAPAPYVIPEDSYVAQGQVAVALSDYVLRYPKIVDAAKLGMEAARTHKRSSEINVGQDARLAYYEWVRAKLQVLISERQHLQVQAVLKQVRALAEVQRLSKADLMRVESQEADAEQIVNQLRNLAVLREQQLRLLIGATDEPLAIGEDIRTELSAPASADVDDLLKRATEHRLEFKVLDVGIRAKERQREAERAGQFPQLSAFATVEYANPNQRMFPQVEEFKLNWYLGLQVTWTINQTLFGQTTVDRLRAEAEQLRADRENLLRGTKLEVLAAQQAVQLAQLALATSQKRLAAAEEGYRVRRELLNAERATAVELVDAETELTRARITALDARVDLRVALVQLSHAIGADSDAAAEPRR